MIYNFSDSNMDGPPPDQRSVDFRSSLECQQSLMAIHNPDSQDLAAAARMAADQINIVGARLQVYLRTDNADFDEVWDEDPDPTYLPPEYIKGFFKPRPMEFELKRWGVDAVNRTEVVFAVSELQQRWGERMLRSGDVIELPYNSPAGALAGGGTLNPRFYRVENGTPSGNYRFHWLYFTCTCETLTADVTVRVVDDIPLDPVEESGGKYDGGP